VSSRISRVLSAAVMMTLIVAVALAQAIRAQAQVTFEVASIHPSPDGLPTTPGGVQITQRQFRASYLSLKDYIAVAYGIPPHQIVAPEWAASTRFEIAAALPAGTTPDQMPKMMQALLAERFQLRTHRESRELPVYALELATGGLKLARAPDDAPSDAPFTVASSGGPDGIVADLGYGASLTFANNRFEAKKVTMATLADTLGRFIDRPIVDMTHAEGRYDVVIDVAPEDYLPMLIRSAVNAGLALPSQALQLLDTASIASVLEGLRRSGLSLHARRAPLETIVVDSLRQTPTEN
jgi:uncharacterized protein (TIGR03435 family)